MVPEGSSDPSSQSSDRALVVLMLCSYGGNPIHDTLYIRSRVETTKLK